MYDVAQDKMNLRQDQYKTYHDRKVADSVLAVDDLVYVFLPRLKRVKLACKWNGPFKVHAAFHPKYAIKIPTDKGIIIKTVTRDKLKKVKNPESTLVAAIDFPRSKEQSEEKQETDEMKQISSDDSSDGEKEEPRYNLQPRDLVRRVFDKRIVHYYAALQ